MKDSMDKLITKSGVFYTYDQLTECAEEVIKTFMQHAADAHNAENRFAEILCAHGAYVCWNFITNGNNTEDRERLHLLTRYTGPVGFKVDT